NEIAVKILIQALKRDPETAVRISAAVALGQRSSTRHRDSLLMLFELAVPDLIDILNKPREFRSDIRARVADALEKIIVQAQRYAGLQEDDEKIKRVVSALLSILKNKHEESEVRARAAYALGRIGKLAKLSVPTLISILDNETENPILRARSADSLGQSKLNAVSDSKAIHSLTKAAIEQNNDVGIRLSAVSALGTIKADIKLLVPVLIKVLENDHELQVRERAAYALGTVGNDLRAVFALISVLKNETQKEGIRATAASALREMASNSGTTLQLDATSTLLKVLNNESSEIRANAAYALESANTSQTKTVIPALLGLLKDNVQQVRVNAVNALEKVILRCQDEGKTASILELEQFISDAEKSSKAVKEVGFSTEKIDRSLESLKLQRQSRLLDRVLEWLHKNPWSLGLFFYFVILPLLWGIIFWLRPLWLLKINKAIDPLISTELPSSITGGFKITIQAVIHITFFAFFRYQNRVLDAWVAEYLEPTQAVFKKKDTVRSHITRVPIMVNVDDQAISNFTSQHLQPTFSRNPSYILICGEGGAGKTSLACQIAQWAMSSEKTERLCSHPMLPVLIEFETDLDVVISEQPLIRSISRQLNTLIGEAEPIPEELLKHLLRQRRVLVIVDRLSEMSEDTQKKIKFRDPDFPVNALIITSRIKEVFNVEPKTTIEPQRLKSVSLSAFMDSYLKLQKKRNNFSDADYFDACRRLSLMVSQRNITVLLAKLYANQMIATKDSEADQSLPVTDNIPDLMLNYLNELNRSVGEIGKLDDRTVHRDMQVIAWNCLKETYQPRTAKRDAVLVSLGNDAESHLEYIENRLRLVKIVQPAQDKVQIVLDPLAEYLAGLYLLDYYGDDKQKWRNFLETADSMKALEPIKGFLLAVLDCCIAKGVDNKIPNFVIDELNKRTKMFSNS
ncbi:MAG: HEAT repeat domain-containing protein, partial [Nostoc sp. C3-bin3]|nr:HEAT repeat domain-containing protein [Nostoc sp. C3-bin3]